MVIGKKGIVHRDLKPGNIMLHFTDFPEIRLPSDQRTTDKLFVSQLKDKHFDDLTKYKPLVKIVDFGHSYNGLNPLGDETMKGNPMTLSPQ